MKKKLLSAICLLFIFTGTYAGTWEMEPAGPPDKFDSSAFLRSVCGTWTCRGDEESVIHLAPSQGEEFTEEFMMNAYFIIRENEDGTFILSGQGIYDIPVEAHIYDENFTRPDKERTFIEQLCPEDNQVIFIRSVVEYDEEYATTHRQPYYHNAPMYPVVAYVDDQLAVYDNDTNNIYFFILTDYSPANGYGVPGDERNLFRINLSYRTATLAEGFRQFARHYPYGASRSWYHSATLEAMSDYEWDSEPSARFESDFGGGKFVLELSKQDDNVHISYYNFYGYTEDEYFEFGAEDVDYVRFGKPHENVKTIVNQAYYIYDPGSPITPDNLREMDNGFVTEYDRNRQTINETHYSHGQQRLKITPHRHTDGTVNYTLVTDHNDILQDSIVRTMPPGTLFREEYFNPENQMTKRTTVMGQGRKIIQEIAYFTNSPYGNLSPEGAIAEKWITQYNDLGDEICTHEYGAVSNWKDLTEKTELFYDYIEYDQQGNWTKRIIKILDDHLLEERTIVYYD